MELLRFTHDLKNDIWEKSFEEKAEDKLDCFGGVAITFEDKKFFLCGKYGSINKGFFVKDNKVFVYTNSCFCKNCVATVNLKKEDRYSWIFYYGALPIMFEMQKDYFGHNIRMYIKYINVHISIDVDKGTTANSWYRRRNDNKNLKPKTIILTFKNNGNIIAEPAMTYKEMKDLFNHKEFFPNEILCELKSYFNDETFWKECKVFDFLNEDEKFDCYQFCNGKNLYQIEKTDVFLKTEQLFENLCKFFKVEPTKELKNFFDKNPQNVVIYKMISYFGFKDYSLLDDYIEDLHINETFNIQNIVFDKKKKYFILLGNMSNLYRVRGEKFNNIFINVLREIIKKKIEKFGEKEAFRQMVHSKVNTKILCYYYNAAKLLNCKEVIDYVIDNEIIDKNILMKIDNLTQNVELKIPTEHIYFNDIKVEFIKKKSDAKNFNNMFISSEEIILNLMGYSYIFVVYEKVDIIGYVKTILSSISATCDNTGASNVSWTTRHNEITFLENIAKKVLELYPYENETTVLKKEENRFSKIIKVLKVIKNALFC